jgi:hypothetical protein
LSVLVRTRQKNSGSHVVSNFQLYVGLTLLLTGLMSLGGAALNLEAFMAHPTAEPLVRKFGRGGARVFYALLGTAFAILGALILLAG